MNEDSKHMEHMEQEDPVLKKLLASTLSTQLGAIVRCAYGVERHAQPRFSGKATVTSDGFVQCLFVRADGGIHHSAFVGSMRDLIFNVRGLADHCKLTDDEKKKYYEVMRRWIADDYRAKKQYFD